jgi:hypothetical protein
MDARDLTPEIVASWLVPEAAVEILSKGLGIKEDDARHVILERLRSGKIRAAAKSSKWENEPRIKETAEILVEPNYWERYACTPGFWKTGDIKFGLGHINSSFSYVSVWYHGIRFDPIAVRAIIPAATPSIPVDSPLAESKSESDPDYRKLPAVSQAHLKSWYEVYRAVYGGSAEDTLDSALSSARGMFPGRFVSRDRVRDLAGGRTPGRKARKES